MKLKQPIARVWSDFAGRVGLAVPCNLDRLQDQHQRDAVHAADNADRAMCGVAGGHLQCFPAKRDFAKEPPGYVYRLNQIGVTGCKGYDAYKARIAKAVLAAAMSLEADGYEVRESTPESRFAEIVREAAEPTSGRRG